MFIEKIFEAKLNENFYNIDNTPSYSLKKCLEKTSNKLLDFLYFNYHFLTKSEKYLIKNISRKEKIMFLVSNLPKRFEDCFDEIISIDTKIFDDILIYKKTKEYNSMLLENGFMYEFNGTYVIPKEFLNIYLNNFSYKRKKIITLKNCADYMHAYLLMNGVIDKYVLYDFLLNKHKLTITLEELDVLALNKNIRICGNYYSILRGNIDFLIKEKQKNSYYYLESNKLMSYLDFFNHFINEFNKLVDSNAIINILCSISSLEDTFNSVVNNFNVYDKEKFKNLLCKYWSRLRFWVINGKTILAFKNEILFDNFLLDKKYISLKDCLDNLDKRCFSNLMNLYEFSPNIDTDTLYHLIIDNFKLNITKYGYNYLLFLMACDNSIIDNSSFEYYDFTSLYLFAYKCGKNNRIIIPKEIMGIIKKYYISIKYGNIVEN